MPLTLGRASPFLTLGARERIKDLENCASAAQIKSDVLSDAAKYTRSVVFNHSKLPLPLNLEVKPQCSHSLPPVYWFFASSGQDYCP